MTIIVVSQKVDHLVNCDRILVMSEAKIVLDGHPRRVYSHRDLLARVGIRVPEVTDFMISLSDKLGGSMLAERLPLTVDEAEAVLKGILRDSGKCQ